MIDADTDEVSLSRTTKRADCLAEAEPIDANPLDSPTDRSQPHLFYDGFVHWWLLGISLFVMIAAVLLSSEGEQQVLLPVIGMPLPELCYSRRMFQLDCPGCGLTRSFINLAHGDFARAWHFHPAGILLFSIIAFQIPFRSLQLWRVYTGRRQWRVPRWELFMYALAALIFLQWVGRMVSGLWW